MPRHGRFVRTIGFGFALGIGFAAACSSFSADENAPPTAIDAGPSEAARESATSSLVCPPGWGDCDRDGKTCETHLLANDVGNCGACGRSCSACGPGCESATCVEGRCDAVLITAQESSPSAIVTDAVGVYWVNGLPNGGLSGAQHGGAARRLVNDPNALRVAVDDNAVYWTSAESGFGAIRRALRGCDASPDCIESLPMSDRIFGIVVDATHIYFTAGQGNTNGGYVGALTKDAPLDAGFAFLAVNESNPVEIAVDDTSVYWTMSAGYNEFDQPNVQGAQRRAKTPSCTFTQDCIPQRLLRAPTWLGIAVDEKSLYLAISETNAGSILRVPRVPKEDAGSFDTIASGQPSPAAIAVDERFVYWVNRGAGSRTGSVMRIARDGSCPAGLPCPEVLIAPGSAASDLPSGIALHQKTIYFTTAGVGANNGAVWRIAK